MYHLNKSTQAIVQEGSAVSRRNWAVARATRHCTTMSDDDWLEPLDRRIEEVRRETEAIRKANAALKRLYDNNHEGMKRLADS
jgi:hypothetical protein